MSVPGLLGVWENLQGRNSVFMKNSWSKEIQKMKRHTRCIKTYLKKPEKAMKKIILSKEIKEMRD